MQAPLKTAMIFDLDGTLCNDNHRRHLLKNKKWDEYYSASSLDEPFQFCCYVLNGCIGNEIIFLTGRPEKYRAITEKWLRERVMGDHKYELLMRANGDYRKNADYKEVTFEEKIKGQYEVLFAIDDNPEVCEMWNRNGITTLFCKQGKDE